MKKINFILLFASLIIIAESGIAQGNILMASINEPSFALDDNSTLLLSKRTTSIKNLPIAGADDKVELSRQYDLQVADDFGAYFNPYSSTIKMKVKKNVSYKNIQLTNLDNGQVVIKKQIKRQDSMLEFTALSAGNYILILTDDSNQISTEKFTVF